MATNEQRTVVKYVVNPDIQRKGKYALHLRAYNKTLLGLTEEFRNALIQLGRKRCRALHPGIALLSVVMCRKPSPSKSGLGGQPQICRLGLPALSVLVRAVTVHALDQMVRARDRGSRGSQPCPFLSAVPRAKDDMMHGQRRSHLVIHPMTNAP